MNNMTEPITIQKYWRRWVNPHLVICVFDNEDLNQVTWEQRVMEGDRGAGWVITGTAQQLLNEILPGKTP